MLPSLALIVVVFVDVVVVLAAAIVVVVLLHLLWRFVLGEGSLTAIECQVKWQCVRRRFAFAICNNQSKPIKI